MVKIRIDSAEQFLSDVGDGWIAHQVNARREDGRDPCVQVSIEEAGISIVLSTPQCVKVGGMGRPLSAAEREIVDLWRKRHLNQQEFSPGDLVAFLHQLARLI